MSNLHRFFYDGPFKEQSVIALDETAAKHIWQVLRMQSDDYIEVTDGKGHVATGTIKVVERHECEVTLEKVIFAPRKSHQLHLAVAFTKNNSRNEWLLEKAAELGVASITPIAAARSEKVHFRDERWEKLLVSALLQSKQDYMPELNNIMPLSEVLKKYKHIEHRFIAHCIDNIPKQTFASQVKTQTETVILIGPEGDFRQDEVELAIENGYKTVSLGQQRLRTETAAISACSFFNLLNDEGM